MLWNASCLGKRTLSFSCLWPYLAHELLAGQTPLCPSQSFPFGGRARQGEDTWSMAQRVSGGAAVVWKEGPGGERTWRSVGKIGGGRRVLVLPLLCPFTCTRFSRIRLNGGSVPYGNLFGVNVCMLWFNSLKGQGSPFYQLKKEFLVCVLFSLNSWHGLYAQDDDGVLCWEAWGTVIPAQTLGFFAF